ncbi:MAG TPA: NADH-quinone oxidoreductase subunit M [Chloroflexaceae bacterium]|nr:NADH-quinone oxidoreductase subunit M [Chloroflexaceae bacterium]
MNLLGFPLLSLVLWTPALGALLLLAVPAGRLVLARRVALAASGVTLALAVAAALHVITGPYGPLGPNGAVDAPPMQLVDRLAWLPSWGASYVVGLDGLNLWMMLLTAFLTPFAIATTWSRHGRTSRAMLALLLVAETAFLGTFLVQDMLLFYIFFEAALIPMVFLVGMWGGHGRAQAAMRLFLYTFTGSVLMLVGIIALYVLHRDAMAALTPAYPGTFDLGQIVADMRSGAFQLTPVAERLLFGAFFAAFAVKLALWPLHTWVPDAYGAAPTPVAIMLAAVMAKFGTYGLIRFNLTLFPSAAEWAAPAVAALAVVGIIYAATVAFAQSDLQRVVAYASISHMNFIVLGIFALNAVGLSGAVFQMVSHGVTTALLLVAVAVLYERREQRELSSFGGLWKVMPRYGGLTMLALLAAAGLPGLMGFIGEFTIMQGVFTSPALGWPYAAGAALGVVLAAVYALRWFRVAFMGEVENSANLALPDLSRREGLLMGALATVVIAGGLFPNLLLGTVRGSVAGVAAYLEPVLAAVARLGL